MWLPEGTNINETDRMASSLADYIRGHEETEMVSTYIGRTPPRYYYPMYLSVLNPIMHKYW